MKVNEMIINLREKRNISQRELANRIGINKSVMNRIESGERDIRAHELEAIANYFDVSADYLLGRSKQNDIADTIAAHIDSNATEEEMEEILAYIEEKRKEHVDEREIDTTDIAAKNDADVAKFVEENPDFKAVAARVMDDEEAVKAVKTFIEYYEQQKKK
ncbi:XRE family transcriptional regulator [Listeria monocytogenes]|uniref:XRE family transcriptional regulator n=1 Tax=Listeria monocytogenes TaxID=1639 RepID=A0AAN2WEE7_LISMN|nr:helix-turn-helix transcriptional regulator [Listeria monocytogenes]AGR24740.1 XRE family transcriptional regulator [Listeria monocytogenes]EAA0218137.1 XRE family transcriptional regulator [Listeria monocytogenes]EAC2329817.1 XRE family transcriptional regulator [Listeria monocytogenes]EAC2619637.1 XRE family transcriptional regulator [Listeria monocytogenes]EAC2792861.1 XRE family transcriptional regulator [Listeria monocytogenes]